jgi:hypothetical protein
MAFQNYVDQVGPVVSAAWLNQVDKLKVTVDNPAGFVNADTTPSVLSGGSFYTQNTGATSITTFDDGVDGQKLDILATDANTTFVNGATLKTNTGANVVTAANRLYVFKRINSIWYMY